MTHIYQVGDLLTGSELDDAPAGVKVTRTARGWEVTEIPQLSDRERLAIALRDAWFGYPRHAVPEDEWYQVADYVLSNFTAHAAHSPELPQSAELPVEVIDGDGDKWFLKSNGKYSGVESSDRPGAVELGRVREASGVTWIGAEGDKWVMQPDGTFSFVRQSGETSTYDEFRNRSFSDINRRFGQNRRD